MRIIAQFLRESRDELVKVSWPTRKQLLHHTFAVVGISLVMAVFLGTLDRLFSFLSETFLFQ